MQLMHRPIILPIVIFVGIASIFKSPGEFLLAAELGSAADMTFHMEGFLRRFTKRLGALRTLR
eukprot:1193530-Pyramimonas_sp.AAC.1